MLRFFDAKMDGIGVCCYQHLNNQDAAC